MRSDNPHLCSLRVLPTSTASGYRIFMFGCGFVFGCWVRRKRCKLGVSRSRPESLHRRPQDEAVFTTIDVPSANQTFAYGINNNGQIVGTYSDASGVHGFLASVPEPSSMFMAGTAAIFGLGAYLRRKCASA
jgi:hypothetical protein